MKEGRMFSSENRYGMVAGFGVRVKDEREKDRNHLVEVNFELPLTFELADEISPAIARDLFNDVKDGWQPKPEISTLGMNLSPSAQLMTIREHPDLDPQIRIAGVTLRKIVAKKGEAGTWLLTFTATWTLGDPKEAITMIQRLKLGVYLTFTEQEPQLDLQGQGNVVDGEVVGKTATVEPGGNVTSITDGKGKGRRRKKTPESEAADQEQDARKRLPAGDPEAGTEAEQPSGDGGDPATE